MLLNAKKLAQELGVTVTTIYNLMEAGIIPQGLKFGKSRRWDLNEVKEWIKNHGTKI